MLNMEKWARDISSFFCVEFLILPSLTLDNVTLFGDECLFTMNYSEIVDDRII